VLPCSDTKLVTRRKGLERYSLKPPSRRRPHRIRKWVISRLELWSYFNTTRRRKFPFLQGNYVTRVRLNYYCYCKSKWKFGLITKKLSVSKVSSVVGKVKLKNQIHFRKQIIKKRKEFTPGGEQWAHCRRAPTNRGTLRGNESNQVRNLIIILKGTHF